MAKNSSGLTCLHLAAGCGDLWTARQLVEWGAVVDAKALNGQTALFTACSNGRRELIAFLLNVGADATIVAEGNETVLHAAAGCSWTHPDTIQWLLDAGADPQAWRVDGKNALMMACEQVLESAITGLVSEEPFWEEDEEDWNYIDPKDPALRMSQAQMGAAARRKSISSAMDVTDLMSKFGITEADMQKARAEMAKTTKPSLLDPPEEDADLTAQDPRHQTPNPGS
mmetsp:Transcript_4581/g.7396  ORF Transcript_4581/g.7396 Transcript_4581/m.7396 type:complete len:227 (+) Transcript_4581:465-1145(+)